MSFDLKVGFSCNNNCVHCVITDKINSGNLSTQQIKDIIYKEVKPGERIVITGGEPTIRKDFIEIIKYIKEETKSPIILQTNGRRFNDEEFTKESVKYIDYYLIAIHSHNEFIHDAITDRKGSWAETIQGIKYLNKYKTNSIINSQTVLSKMNVDNLLKTYDFIHNVLGINAMNMTFPHPNGNAFTNIDVVVPQYITIKKSIHQCFEKYGNLLYVEAIPLCYIHPYVNQVYYSDGDRLLSNGNRGHDHAINDVAIEDYNKLIREEYRKPKTCEDCIYNKRCIGVWKEYYEKYKNNLDLIPIKE